MSLPTINLTKDIAKDVTLDQVGSTDLSTYTRIELRSEDASLVLSSADALELELTGSNENLLCHFSAFTTANKRYAYWLAGITGGVTTDLAGRGYIVVREEA